MSPSILACWGAGQDRTEGPCPGWTSLCSLSGVEQPQRRSSKLDFLLPKSIPQQHPLRGGLFSVFF